jgi:UDP-N-acetylmuramyl pentapeptide phosphotransferase/UDP-N-acetylglucosamine-1-phosphate transferase
MSALFFSRPALLTSVVVTYATTRNAPAKYARRIRKYSRSMQETRGGRLGGLCVMLGVLCGYGKLDRAMLKTYNLLLASHGFSGIAAVVNR